MLLSRKRISSVIQPCFPQTIAMSQSSQIRIDSLRNFLLASGSFELQSSVAEIDSARSE